jgi:hypothetical protein
MATFGIVHRFPGGTREQYENMLEVVHPDAGKELPEGQLLHLAGPTGDGWLVMAVHESRESWERFRDDTLVPGLASVDNGLPAPRGDDVRRPGVPDAAPDGLTYDDRRCRPDAAASEGKRAVGPGRRASP